MLRRRRGNALALLSVLLVGGFLSIAVIGCDDNEEVLPQLGLIFIGDVIPSGNDDYLDPIYDNSLLLVEEDSDFKNSIMTLRANKINLGAPAFIDFNIHYDGTIVSYLELRPGDYLGPADQIDYFAEPFRADTNNAYVRMHLDARSDNAPLSESGTVATILFTAEDAGTATLRIRRSQDAIRTFSGKKISGISWYGGELIGFYRN